MTEFPSYQLSLADGTNLTLASADEHAANLLTRFAAAAQLEPGNGSGRRLLVTSNDRDLPAELTEGSFYRFWPIKNDPAYFRDLFGLSHAVARQIPNGILLHGALAEHEGRGVVLIAKGGTGKTTASERLPSSWRSLCDDITLLVRDALGNYWAHPWPTWSRFRDDGPGGRWEVQRAVPLTAIFHLSQAEADWVEPIGAGEAVIFLVQSAEQVFLPVRHAFDTEYLRKWRLEQFDKISALARCTPVSELHLSMDGCFWRALEDALEGQWERING